MHTASKNGRKVVVKGTPPGIEKKIIRRDVGLLYLLPDWPTVIGRRRVVCAHGGSGRLQKTILDELDLQREAANAAQLHRNWEGSDLLYVPEIFWDLTRKTYLSWSEFQAPVGDIDSLKTQGISMRQLGEQGGDLFHPGIQG